MKMILDKANVTVQGNWKRSFFTIWGGQAFSLLGSSLVQFALIWYLTEKTGSATILAVASLFGMLPQILIGPLAGAFVDRWNRKAIMITADASVAISTLILIVLFRTGLVQVWHIYLILFVRSLGGAFHFPAMQSSTSLMVPSNHLPRVAGINQALRGAMAIAAPPLGALLVGLLPMHSVLSIDIITALLAIIPIALVSIPQPKRDNSTASNQPRMSIMDDFRAGLKYVYTWPALMIIMGVAMAINFLFVPAFSLLPLLVTKHFSGGIYQLSWIQSALGVGMITGGILLGVWGGFRNKLNTSVCGLILMGTGVMAVGFAPANAFWLGVVGIFAAGLSNPFVDGPLFAVLQSTVEPDMQGRVLGLIISLGTAVSPLSLLIAGPLSDRFGISLWYVLGGATCVIMGIGLRFVPAVMQLESRGHPKSKPHLETLAGAAD